MNGSLLRVFALEYDDKSRTISPHVRYISPANVLIFGSVVFAKVDDEGKLIEPEHDEVHLLRHFACL